MLPIFTHLKKQKNESRVQGDVKNILCETAHFEKQKHKGRV